MSEIPHDLKETLGLPTAVFRSFNRQLKKEPHNFFSSKLGQNQIFYEITSKN